ncbi:hypothetical protein [Marininema halotolerans]|nr:hypothetical protein [Marininema halotolerans]
MATFAKHIVIVIGNPIATLAELGLDDCGSIYRTEERYLPRVLVDCGVFPSTSAVRKNRTDLLLTLDKLDWLTFRIGKRCVDIVVGE